MRRIRLNMLPDLTMNNATYMGLLNTKFWGECCLGFSIGKAAAHFNDIVCSQLRPPVGFASHYAFRMHSHSRAVAACGSLWHRMSAIAFAKRSSTTSSCFAVSNILRLRAYVEMIKAYTGRIVTVMKDTQSIRNRSIGISPCPAMCQHGTKDSIPPHVPVSSPDPALGSLINMTREPHLRRTTKVSHCLPLYRQVVSAV